MSKAKEFLNEFETPFRYLDNAKISESSMSRLLSQIKDPVRDFAFLTAFRKHIGDKEISKAENRKRNKELMSTFLKPNKLGATKVVGSFKEKGETEVGKEESFFVIRPNGMSSEEFEKIVSKAIKKYDQDSALIGVNGKAYFIDQSGKKSEPLTQIKNIDTKDLDGYFTRLKGKTFQLEGMYVPSGFANAGAFKIDGLLYEADL